MYVCVQFVFEHHVELSPSAAVANLDVSLLEQSPSALLEPPELKGYLNKYANVAKGYSTRWFVLRDGVLSCTLPFPLPPSPLSLTLTHPSDI